MERLLPDVEYHIHLHHHQKHRQLIGKGYSMSNAPPTQDVDIKQNIKQEPETVPFSMQEQCSEPAALTGHHSFNSRSIVHVSCENQHVSAGIDTASSTMPTVKYTAASTTVNDESLNFNVDRNALVNQHTFTNNTMAYNSSQNSGNVTDQCPNQSIGQYQYGYQMDGSHNLQLTANHTLPGNRLALTAGKPIRHGYPRYCGVCGDVAKSYHFGGLSCDSCKAFFRRSVHNDNYLHFQCYHNGQCSITVINRKSCQYCRMKRCLGIGMEKSWVMTEEERKALMKTRAENKLKKQLAAVATLANSKSMNKEVHQSLPVSKLSKELKLNNYEPQVDRMIDYLSITEIREIELVVTKYASAFQQVPYRAQLLEFNENRPGFQVMEMFGTLIRRFAVYARTMDPFTSLSSQDQKLLLKGGVLEMCILRGAQLYDPTAKRWPKSDASSYKNTPSLKLENITQLTSSLVFQKHMEFVSSIQRMQLDEPIVMLLVLIVLFSKRPGLEHAEKVEESQGYYTSLLERYIDWRFGPLCSKTMFHQLLAKLNDLKSLSEVHNHENMRLGKDEFSSIQQQLQHLKINPYAKINLIQEDNWNTYQYQDTAALPPSSPLVKQISSYQAQTSPLTITDMTSTHVNSQLAVEHHAPFNVPQVSSSKLIEPASKQGHCNQQSWYTPLQQSPPALYKSETVLEQFAETRGMPQYTDCFGAATPESIQQSVENNSSFLSSPSSSSSSSSCSSDFNSGNLGANAASSIDLRDQGFPAGQPSGAISFGCSTNNHHRSPIEHSQLSFTNLDCQVRGGLIEAGGLALALDSSPSPFVGQLSSTSSVTGPDASLRFSRMGWPSGGSESITSKEQMNESVVTDPLLSLTPTATVALFNELERYSDHFQY